jgi:hypothetical protein
MVILTACTFFQSTTAPAQPPTKPVTSAPVTTGPATPHPTTPVQPSAPVQSPTQSEAPTSLPTPTGTVWPLTGIATDKVAQTPALAVKIENDHSAYPLTGLEFADNVWEETVEGGISRFVAVFHSDIPKAVEPIRSVRPMDAGIVAPLGGMIAFSGGQPGFVQEVDAAGVQTLSMDRGDRGFSRDHGPGRFAPHNVIGDMEKFMSQARSDRTSPPPQQFLFAIPGKSTAETSGTAAQKITARFSGLQTTIWDWDTKTSTWLRSDGGQGATIKTTSSAGTRLSATSVVLLHVVQTNTGTVDPAGTPVMETVMVDSGTGMVASGGKTVNVKWSKSATDAPVVLTTLDGAPVLLEPGRTWVELVVSSMGDWTIDGPGSASPSPSPSPSASKK